MDDPNQHTSKMLSFWLRHRPDAAGLTLDQSGWAKVDDVLAAFAAQGSATGWESLLQIVETNDKRRFELSADASLIRARQGHSIEVTGDWVAASPPDHLWHGTVERFLASIMAEGLKPMGRHHVHLSADRETAERVGSRRGRPVILCVNAKRLIVSGQAFWRAGNGVWLTDAVPPDALSHA
ncbi:MAG: RNA 2'-phosphotransferase [Proteobacteria bacterium]|nr:RNA 2'-phosphotransferase [Pseudomonadota bacterium]